MGPPFLLLPTSAPVSLISAFKEDGVGTGQPDLLMKPQSVSVKLDFGLNKRQSVWVVIPGRNRGRGPSRGARGSPLLAPGQSTEGVFQV